MAMNSSQGMALLVFLVAFTGLGWAVFLLERRIGRTRVCPSADERKLTYQEKFSRLATRWRDPQWRHYGMLLLTGKALGIALLFGVITFGTTLYRATSGTSVYAQQEATASPGAAATPTAAPDPYKTATAGGFINPVNTGWVLLGAILVFGMQAGFTMLEAGFCRNRETVNVLVECMFDTCVCGLLHWGWGFAFMFGGGNAFPPKRPPQATRRQIC